MAANFNITTVNFGKPVAWGSPLTLEIDIRLSEDDVITKRFNYWLNEDYVSLEEWQALTQEAQVSVLNNIAQQFLAEMIDMQWVTTSTKQVRR